MEIRFDPRDLIGPPFIECAACHQMSFGVLQVAGTEYTRRCRECWATQRLPLWPVQKKVIYIDQFAVSNMMKSINVAMASHDRAKADPFWLELFEALERVCKLQLVACPYSGNHRNESLMVPYFVALKRMYEHLSHGVSFGDLDEIVSEQIAIALNAWLRNEQPVYDFSPACVSSGGLHDYQDRLLISVEVTYPDEMVEGIRRFRDELHDSVARVFEFYQKSGHTDFEHWIQHERQQGSDSVLKAAQLYADRLRQMIASGTLDFNQLYRSRGFDHFQLIVGTLELAGVEPKEILGRVRDFVNSETYRDVPAHRISALMWAVIAHRASQGQKQPPNRGMSNDIDVVATLLPYCDAMFVDRECAALLGNIPKGYSLGYGTAVFSPASRTEFLEYLRRIEAEADPCVLSCVRNVYGDSWPTPFLSMYQH